MYRQNNPELTNDKNNHQQAQVQLHHKARCILRLPEVQKRTGYKRTHIYNLMKQGKFPQRVKVGIRSVGWDSYEIEQWVDAQLAIT